MKSEKWMELNDSLVKGYSTIKEAYVNSGAYKNPENDKLITEWNDKINKVLQEIRELYEEMIFTLKIED